jgi:ribosomal protein S27E
VIDARRAPKRASTKDIAAHGSHAARPSSSPWYRVLAKDSRAQANAALVDSLSDPRGDGWKRFVRGYLSADHRGDPASGCTLGRRERLPGLPRLRNPHPGLRRVRCGECGNELLVAFSCKRRGICPSCNALNALCACR